MLEFCLADERCDDNSAADECQEYAAVYANQLEEEFTPECQQLVFAALTCVLDNGACVQSEYDGQGYGYFGAGTLCDSEYDAADAAGCYDYY